MPTRAFAPLAAVAALALALVSAGLCAAPAAAPALPAHELTAQDAQAWPDGLMPTALRTARAPGAVISIVKACAARGGVGGVNGIGIFLGDNDASLARVFGGNWLRVAREVWQPPF